MDGRTGSCPLWGKSSPNSIVVDNAAVTCRWSLSLQLTELIIGSTDISRFAHTQTMIHTCMQEDSDEDGDEESKIERDEDLDK